MKMHELAPSSIKITVAQFKKSNYLLLFVILYTGAIPRDAFQNELEFQTKIFHMKTMLINVDAFCRDGHQVLM